MKVEFKNNINTLSTLYTYNVLQQHYLYKSLEGLTEVQYTMLIRAIDTNYETLST